MAETSVVHEQTDPLSRDVLFRQVGSLIGTVLLGMISMAMQQVPQGSETLILQAATVTAGTVVAVVLVPWNRVHTLFHGLVPFAYLTVVYVLSRSTGGASSSYAQLALLPILWVGVYGTSREVTATVAGAALVLFALRVAPGTTGSDWAQAFMLAVLGAILGQLVNRFFARIRTQTSRLQALAGTDPLTGAANRRAWDEELVGSMVRARRNGRPVSLVLLDLDEFKEYNDRNGHQAGDILLKEAASAWQNILRASDILARIGGDEFGILLPGCHLEMAASIAERLRCAYPSAKCSVGVAVWDGSEDKEMLVARTDAALYEAKQRGRGRMVVVPDVGKPAPHTTEPAPYTTELPA